MALSPAIFEHLPDGPGDIIEALTAAMAAGGEVCGWTYEPAIWSDMGTVEDYWRLNRDLAAGRTIVHSTARVDGTLTGWNVVGAEAVIEEGAGAENCVICPGAALARGAVAEGAVIAGPVPAQTRVTGGCFCDRTEG
jgi:NDP-sugar pyrophosphorylase family protein